MPELKYSKQHKFFYWVGKFEDRKLPENAGFKWHKDGFWYTNNLYKAVELYDYADDLSKVKLSDLYCKITQSYFSLFFDATTPAPENREYYPFQKVSILLSKYKDRILLADEMGLGKTVQALGIANYKKISKLLVICPASLRYNWEREYNEWMVDPLPTQIITNKKQDILKGHTTIISYELVKQFYPILRANKYDMVICDEAHYLKNKNSIRTQYVLGSNSKDITGVINLNKRSVFLSGTPIENYANEWHNFLTKVKPEVIDNMSYWDFISRFCVLENDNYGVKITGSKNEFELHNRLRSGFMVRRMKKAVLPQLPDKQYNMIVVEQDNTTKRIIRKEVDFNANDIVEHGVPVGSALPELRQEMGLAKVPYVVDYINNMIEGGAEKILVFAWHHSVIDQLQQKLKHHRPVSFTGRTSEKLKQIAIDRFKSDPEIKIFIGNLKAAGVGLNLTEAHEVVIAEPSFTPGVNEQAIDRAHRIGQEHKVNIHFIVVKNSLDARILEIAYQKQDSIRRILNGG